MKVAILLYGKKSTTSDLISLADGKFSVHPNTDVYKNFSTDNEFENLRLACFSKIEKEVDTLTHYDLCIAVNAEFHWLISKIDLTVDYKTHLIYLRGKFNSNETYVEHDIFYGNSLMMNCACEYPGPQVQPFFNYLKVMNIPVKCPYVSDPEMFGVNK